MGVRLFNIFIFSEGFSEIFSNGSHIKVDKSNSFRQVRANHYQKRVNKKFSVKNLKFVLFSKSFCLVFRKLYLVTGIKN